MDAILVTALPSRMGGVGIGASAGVMVACLSLEALESSRGRLEREASALERTVGEEVF